MNQITCGIDWAEGHHDVALLDHEGQLLARRRIVESVEGFAELVTLLAETGDSTEDPIPVAIETPAGCWSPPFARAGARSTRSTRWP